MTLAFLDCETTGLDPDRHEIWELAVIVDGEPHVWQFAVDLPSADPTGLRVGRYYERAENLPSGADALVHGDEFPYWYHTTRRDAAFEIARLLDGRHLVGAVPSFDAAFLGRFLNRFGQAATWHYHLVDVEALAAGALMESPPWNSNELSRMARVDPEQFDRHTALGDALWAKALYEAVIVEGVGP